MKKAVIGLIMLTLLMFALTACDSKDGGNDVSKQEATGNDNKDTANKEEADQSEDNNQTDTSLEYVKNKGKLILGLDDSFPPMGFRDDAGNIVGFDIDLAEAVCKKLGVELVVEPIKWIAKEHELNTKSIDCIWNGFSVTPDRVEQLSMSIPYMENKLAIVVKNGSGIESKEDLAGKRLAVQGGSSAEEALNTEENKEFRESLGEINSSFKDYVTAVMDLETGNSDAVLMDSVVATYMIHEVGKDFVILDDYLLAEEYAIGFRKGEEALVNAVNEALRELKADQTVAEISEKWFGSDITIIE
ncbi:amino acid ABC transporter substrate-binding protein [Herbinix luporum]|jgi:polar amino acid transport system substrate-binding protein|uniref:Solute-binding protein family 3/N-terminal domain-containing protein n=1 Tax=Herbinix luporum TaxID=1679721 RepID=A0A0K8J540_9FIRM|nr:amino acid ABC transporter substrate-binding protein [Herbinix luporum]CUH92453.1 hypothetical protein SD1D_0906 [Herbinix luporum]